MYDFSYFNILRKPNICPYTWWLAFFIGMEVNSDIYVASLKHALNFVHKY